VSDAWRSAKIKEFEHVMVGSAGGLLRISGKAPRRKSTLEPRPTLLADDGLVVRRFTPIPSPPDERGVVRAAYSASADVLKPDTVFSLELSDGYVISLPALTTAPQEGSGVQPPQDASASETARSGAEDDQPLEPTAELAELSTALAEAERATAEHKAARATAEARAASAERRATEVAAGLSELDIWRGELERRLADTTSELDAARTRLREDERELRDLRGRIRQLESEREEVARQAGHLADLLRSAERLAERLRVAADDTGDRVDGSTTSARPTEPEAPAEAAAEVEAIGRRAETDAAERAARELAEAADEARSRH
jgi:hypothetical protein